MDYDLLAGSYLHTSDAAHEAAYLDAMDAYEREAGKPADASWRALLFIGTADLIFWDQLQPRLDYRQEKADLSMDMTQVGNSNYSQLLTLARHLHGGPGAEDCIYLASMLRSLPERYYRVLMGALRAYRGTN